MEESSHLPSQEQSRESKVEVVQVFKLFGALPQGHSPPERSHILTLSQTAPPNCRPGAQTSEAMGGMLIETLTMHLNPVFPIPSSISVLHYPGPSP